MATTTTTAISRPIPGPRAVPLLGWRAGLIALFRDPFAGLQRLHDTYGDVVAMARGDAAYVFGFGPEMNHRILATPEVFDAGTAMLARMPQHTALARVNSHSIASTQGERHRQQRRLMQPAFHRQGIEAYRDIMVQRTRAMLDQWGSQPTVELNRAMRLLTRRIVVEALFGMDDDAESDRLGTLMQQMIAAAPLALIVPVDVPGSPYRRAVHVAGELEATIHALIARKRAQPDATDLLAVLVHTRDAGGESLTDEELVSNVFALFTAGHETTANALTWTPFLLAQHPPVFAALLDELDAALHGDAPTAAQLAQLPLLDAVVKESLRLLPPAIIGQRAALVPTDLGGYALPAGATAFYSPFVTHRLPELYAEPHRFDPARWETLHPSPYEYLPFAAGPHMCIGWAFATQEIKIVLAMLVQRYRLALAPNTKASPTTHMNPKGGMRVRPLPQDRQFARVPVRGTINELVGLAG